MYGVLRLTVTLRTGHVLDAWILCTSWLVGGRSVIALGVNGERLRHDPGTALAPVNLFTWQGRNLYLRAMQFHSCQTLLLYGGVEGPRPTSFGHRLVAVPCKHGGSMASSLNHIPSARYAGRMATAHHRPGNDQEPLRGDW